MNKPLVYIILGAAGAGRREIVADLIESGLDAEQKPAVWLSAGEVADAADARLGEIVRWTLGEDGQIVADWPTGATVGFFITDGRSLNPIDQLEALKPWIVAQGAEVARVLTVVHCQLASQDDRLLVWYDACGHFSDMLLLNRRDGVENKWMSDLRTRIQKQFMPCLIEVVKKGRVHNPALVLDTLPRRMSHWFDEEPHWAAFPGVDADTVIEDEAGDDPDEALEAEDPYFARHPSGRRIKEIPDIGEWFR